MHQIESAIRRPCAVMKCIGGVLLCRTKHRAVSYIAAI